AGGGVVAGVVSAEVAALVQGANKVMFRSKVKAVIVLALALGVAAAGFAAARPAAPPEDDRAQAGAAPPQAPVGRAAAARPGEGPRESVEISGRVLDPEGKPFAGAKLYLATWAPEGFKVEERAASGEDGAFRFTMPKADFDKSSLMKWWEHTRLMAVAKGYGPDLVIF